MFEQIGDVLAGARGKASRTPVRRHSKLAGHCEGFFWRRTIRQETQQILLAAKRYDLAGRRPGERNGPLGGVAIELLELFANLVNFKSGRLEPSLDFLMRKLKRSRDAIVRAKKALQDHGFLDWLRRYVPTGNEGCGPRVQQTSNAYRLSLPARALAFLGRFGMAPPLPDDHVQADAARAAEIEVHRASLSLEHRTLFDIGDTPLGQALARLAKSIQQRESVRQPESPTDSILPIKERGRIAF